MKFSVNVLFHRLIIPETSRLYICSSFQVLSNLHNSVNGKLIETATNKFLYDVTIEYSSALVDLRIALKNFLKMLIFNWNGTINNSLFKIVVKLFGSITCHSKGMNDSSQLFIIQVILASVKFFFKRLPNGMITEIVLLEHQSFGNVYQGRSQELRYSLNNICKENLIYSVVSHGEHLSEALFRQLNDFFKGLVEFDLSQFMGIADYIERFISPLFV
jgi:hypothetical protein